MVETTDFAVRDSLTLRLWILRLYRIGSADFKVKNKLPLRGGIRLLCGLGSADFMLKKTHVYLNVLIPIVLKALACIF